MYVNDESSFRQGTGVARYTKIIFRVKMVEGFDLSFDLLRERGMHTPSRESYPHLHKSTTAKLEFAPQARTGDPSIYIKLH